MDRSLGIFRPIGFVSSICKIVDNIIGNFLFQANRVDSLGMIRLVKLFNFKHNMVLCNSFYYMIKLYNLGISDIYHSQEFFI